MGLPACGFKPLDGFFSYLQSSSNGRDRWFDLSDDLLELLPEYDDWTTLAVYDGRAMEVVVAKNYCGYLIFDRGAEDTTAKCFPANSYVSFIMTRKGVEAMACCDKWFENCMQGV